MMKSVGLLRAKTQAGFTLLELIVVLAIVGLATAGVSVTLRDDTMTRLEREALRLGSQVDAARAHSQVTGLPVRLRLTPQGFRFEPEVSPTQTTLGRWLDPDTGAVIEQVRISAARSSEQDETLLLGPDAIIGAQAVVLFSRSKPQQRVRLATDGVRPFAVQDSAP